MPRGDIGVRHDRAMCLARINRDGCHGQPAVGFRQVACVLDGEALLRRIEHGTNALGHATLGDRSTFPFVADVDVVEPNRVPGAAFGCPTIIRQPRVIYGDDRAGSVEQGDTGRQRIENRVLARDVALTALPLCPSHELHTVAITKRRDRHFGAKLGDLALGLTERIQ